MARAVNGFIINRYPAILRNRGQATSRVGNAMRSLAQNTTNVAKLKVAAATPRSLGILASSTKNKVVFDLTTNSQVGVVYQDATRGGFPYAGSLRHGMAPGTRIPYKALIPWVQRNIPTRRPGRVAFFIAESLAKSGRVGYDYAKEPIQNMRRQIGSESRAALLPQVNSLVRG